MTTLQNFIAFHEKEIEKCAKKLEIETKRYQRILELKNKINFDKISKAFVSMKFEILREPTFSFTHREDVDFSEDSLGVSFRVKSVGSFKPILFAGYTKSSSGRNDHKLTEKAEKLEIKMKELTGYECDVNKYGMEVKNKGDEFTFSIDFSIQ